MQNDVRRLRRMFREGRAGLFTPAARTSPCVELLENHALLIDHIIEEIYLTSCKYADRKTKSSNDHSELAIVATGGYGRRELSPFSDIDIAFIPSEEEDPWVESVVHVAFKLVMDVFLSFREIRVGYSFRPVSEASTWDLATKTALLDARLICGERQLANSLQSRLRQVLSPLDLILEVNEASLSSKHKNLSLYSVEPNLKEGPGSLRDFQRGRWIYKLLLGESDSTLVAALQKHGYVTSQQLSKIQAAAEWLWSARNWLHLVAGRRSDVLINNHQDQIARDMGMDSAQEWLSTHYANAETVAQFREAAIRRAMDGPLDLGGVKVEQGSLCLRKDGRVKDLAVRLLHLSQKYAIPISSYDFRALEAERPQALSVTKPSPEEAWDFVSIFKEKREIAATLRALLRFGLMDRFINGFSAVMRFAPPDSAHSHTVGEHSLRIIEHLEVLRHGSHATGQRFGDLLAQCQHFDMLCLAALLHDIGKLLPGSDHCETAMEPTAAVSECLNLAPEKREILELLVRHHLLLVRTARLYDLNSATAIQIVAEKVANIDALRHLYVFSYVDTKAVAENNWTSMDYRDLEELYEKVFKQLSGDGQETSDDTAIVEDKIGLIRRKLAGQNGLRDEKAVAKHCDAMPAAYVLNTPLEEIVYHIQLLNRLERGKVVLDVYNRPGEDFSELTICTYDEPQPGMLARITGVLYGCNVDIHKAQVFTMERKKPVVLDTLWISSDGRQISEHRARRVKATLEKILTGSQTVEQYLIAAGKRPPSGIPLDSMDLRNDLSEEHTVVHIIARDLQGLLYLMTRTLSRSGLHIHAAKVATWNARAENNFYVTTLSGQQIPDTDLSQWTKQLTNAFRGNG